MKKEIFLKILSILMLLIIGYSINSCFERNQAVTENKKRTYSSLISNNKFDEAYVMYKKNSKILNKNLLAYDGFYFYFEKHDYVSALKYFDLLKADLKYHSKDIFYEKIVIKLFEKNHFDDAVFWHEKITGGNKDDFVLKFKEITENLILNSNTEKALSYYNLLLENNVRDLNLDDICLKKINNFLANEDFDSISKFYKEALNNNFLSNKTLSIFDFLNKYDIKLPKNFYAENGYNVDGFNKKGYNKEGFNVNGLPNPNSKTLVDKSGKKYINSELSDFKIINNKIYYFYKNTNKKISGNLISYDENGYVTSVIQVRNGLNHGKLTSYFPNGNIEYSYTSIEGEAQGIQNFYYENGNIKSTSNFVNGKIVGYSTEYDEAGNVTEKVKYINGIPERLYNSMYEAAEIYTEALGKQLDELE